MPTLELTLLCTKCLHSYIPSYVWLMHWLLPLLMFLIPTIVAIECEHNSPLLPLFLYRSFWQLSGLREDLSSKVWSIEMSKSCLLVKIMFSILSKSYVSGIESCHSGIYLLSWTFIIYINSIWFLCSEHALLLFWFDHACDC